MSEKTLPEVGSRWRCTQTIGCVQCGTTVTVARIDAIRNGGMVWFSGCGENARWLDPESFRQHMVPADATAPEVGMRVMVQVDSGSPWRTGTIVCLNRVSADGRDYIDLRHDDTPTQVGGWDRDRWGKTMLPFPAAAPAPEPAAAKWKKGDLVSVCGRIVADVDPIPGIAAVLFNGARTYLAIDVNAVRPEAAPAAPGGDTMPTEEYDRVSCKLVLTEEKLSTVKAELEELRRRVADDRHESMRVGDLRADKARMAQTLGEAHARQASLTRELAAVRKERDEWRAKWRRREGL
jgi:hypothetical protein